MKTALLVSRTAGMAFLFVLLALNGCAVTPTQPPTSFPTATASRASTSAPENTLTVTQSPTTASSPIATPQATRTQDSFPSNTPIPTATETFRPDPATIPTVVVDGEVYCDPEFTCLRSPDGKWLAQGVGRWFRNLFVEDKPYLILFRPDGKDAKKIYYDLNFGCCTYFPWFFDENNRWLFAKVNMDGSLDGPVVPIAFGLVKIEIETGRVVPLLGLNDYYGISRSPDGTKIGYTLSNMAGVFDLETGKRSLYALSYKYSQGVLWNADSARFVTAAIRDVESDTWTTDVLLISPGSSQPVQLIFSYPERLHSWEWAADDGLLLEMYERDNISFKTIWFRIDPDNPTPIPVPSPTPD